ncbi:MAG: T9SS type A sorting domain-containing protein, partial [Bacteroidota bacterium]
ADTSQLDPITWSFDNKVANYKVSARSFHNNGCFGEFNRTVSVCDVSGLTQFDREAKITSRLVMVSNTWQLVELEVFDVQGKCIYRSHSNEGVPSAGIAQGIYTYKIKAQSTSGSVEKSGKWLNFE